MIIVSTPSKPFTYTGKMTARRPAIIADYEPEIEALYAAVEATTRTLVAFPPSWTPEASLVFARTLIGSVLKQEVSDEDDVFQHGCDRFVAVRLFFLFTKLKS